MRYLLDTHALLWFLEGSPKMSPVAVAIVEDGSASKSVSVASLWELAIKLSLDKLRIDGGLAQVLRAITANHFGIAPISLASLDELTRLPFIHRDPFDRLLGSTALAEDFAIVTADADIRRYDARAVW